MVEFMEVEQFQSKVAEMHQAVPREAMVAYLDLRRVTMNLLVYLWWKWTGMTWSRSEGIFLELRESAQNACRK